MKNSMIIAFCLLISMMVCKEVSAEEKTMKFSILPVIEENQTKGINSYFDLNVSPGEELTLYINVKNMKNEPSKIYIEPTNALTTKNGGIYYTSDKKTEYTYFIDETFAIKNRINVQRIVELKANETKKVKVKVKVPNKDKGVYIGGMLFYSDDIEVEKEKSNDDVNFTINNKYALAMAIKLNLEEKVEGEITFEDTKAEIFPSGVQIFVEMLNKKETISIGEKTKFDVFDEKNKKIFGGEIGEIKMAPKTGIKYPIFWNAEQLKNGKYKIKITTQVDGIEITYEDKFWIEKKQVKEYVEKVNKDTNQVIVDEKMPWWIWILIATVMILSFYIGLKIKRK